MFASSFFLLSPAQDKKRVEEMKRTVNDISGLIGKAVENKFLNSQHLIKMEQRADELQAQSFQFETVKKPRIGKKPKKEKRKKRKRCSIM